jgi:hypothetical protein
VTLRPKGGDIDDELWEVVQPLWPDLTPQRTGCPRVGNQAAFTAIVFVLMTGVFILSLRPALVTFEGKDLAYEAV